MKNKTLKELLIILKDSIENHDNVYPFAGFCFKVENLWAKEIINYDEFEMLTNFLHENKPMTFYRIFNSGYWWKVGHKEPRLKWLNKQINKIK